MKTRVALAILGLSIIIGLLANFAPTYTAKGAPEFPYFLPIVGNHTNFSSEPGTPPPPPPPAVELYSYCAAVGGFNGDTIGGFINRQRLVQGIGFTADASQNIVGVEPNPWDNTQKPANDGGMSQIIACGSSLGFDYHVALRSGEGVMFWDVSYAQLDGSNVKGWKDVDLSAGSNFEGSPVGDPTTFEKYTTSEAVIQAHPDLEDEMTLLKELTEQVKTMPNGLISYYQITQIR